MWFRFSNSLDIIKWRRARFGLSFAVVTIIKIVFVIKLRLYEGRRSQRSFGFPFDILQFVSLKSLKIFKICGTCPADHLKAQKSRGYKGSFFAIFNFVFSSFFTNLALWKNLYWNRTAPRSFQQSFPRCFWLTYFSGVRGLWMLRVQLLKTLDSIS